MGCDDDSCEEYIESISQIKQSWDIKTHLRFLAVLGAENISVKSISTLHTISTVSGNKSIPDVVEQLHVALLRVRRYKKVSNAPEVVTAIPY